MAFRPNPDSHTDPASEAAAGQHWGRVLLVPLALTVTVYARTLSGPFLFDDEVAIVGNPAIKDLGRFLTEEALREVLSGGRALTDLTFAVNYAVGRLDPWGFHATNLAIHVLATLLVFAFTRRVAILAGAGRPAAIAVVVAGIFALHPIQTQAVSYVVQRAESLASAIYLSVLLLLLDSERHAGSWRGRVAWAGALLAFAAGLTAKAILVTAPVAYLLVTAIVGGTAEARSHLVSWRRRLILVAPLGLLAIAYAARLLGRLGGAADAGFDVAGLPAPVYFATQLRVAITYLRLLVWPAGQNVDWDVAPVTGPGDLRAWGSALLLAGLAAIAVALAVRGRREVGPGGAAPRLAALGVGWYAVVLAPTSTVVPIADVLVEHRLYLPSWGMILALVAGADHLAARFGARGHRAWVAAVWIGLALLTWQRNAVWESGLALWQDAIEKAPGNARAALALGRALRIEGRHAEAIAVYRRALEHAPGNVSYQSKLRGNLGVVQGQLGDVDGALSSFQQAVELDPTNVPALANVAAELLRRGDDAEAEAAARRILDARPDSVEGLTTMGLVALARRDPAGALPYLDRAVALNPDIGHVRYHRGRANGELGRLEAACRDLRDALRASDSNGYRRDCMRLLAGWCGGG